MAQTNAAIRYQIMKNVMTPLTVPAKKPQET